jgi:spore coat polysaccharide biosynthesis predicted glycosyltransferase SpsG/2-polyprenyl-3-methyl-5-hydroxy-6-metoxy-1,4-benzoquinol methylase
MMKKFIVIIRVDGHFKIGLGHLIRSLTIADYLSDHKNVTVKFIITKKTRKFFNEFSKRTPLVLNDSSGGLREAVELVSIARREKAGLLITDSYYLKKELYALLRSNIPTLPVLAIDDWGEKAGYPVMGFVNFGLPADKIVYPKALQKYSLLGARYFPLRKEFLRVPLLSRKELQLAGNIFLMMGGSDPQDQTLRFIRIIKGIKQIKRINVVLGPGYKNERAAKSLVREDKRFRLYFAPRNIASIMRQSDLAFAGAGVSACELLSLGVPTALVILAKNQEELAKALALRKCGYLLGWFNSFSDKKLKERIETLVKNPRLRLSLSKNALNIFDRRGGKRLAESLVNLLRSYHCETHNLQQVRREYELSSRKQNEHEKVKWGSSEGMFNRFYLAEKVINWSRVRSWLDIGSGTGAFLKELEKEKQIMSFLGVDLSPAMIKFSKQQVYKTNRANFRCQSFFDPVIGYPYDLVTCIGVLQKCGIPLNKAVSRLAELVKLGGQVFVTTKNLDWERFKEPDFFPEKGHKWFSLAEIREAFALAGLTIKKLEGFEPRIKGKVCRPQSSHSVYILAQKDNKL